MRYVDHVIDLPPASRTRIDIVNAARETDVVLRAPHALGIFEATIRDVKGTLIYAETIDSAADLKSLRIPVSGMVSLARAGLD